MKLAFGPFLPDLPDHGSPGVSGVSNLYPVSTTGWRPVGQWSSHSNSMLSRCRGAAAFVAPSGRTMIIAGTQDTLYVRDGVAWDPLAGGPYSVSSEGRWRFVQFGGIAIVTNANDPLVSVNLETDATANLGGSPPTFEALAVVNNFVVGTRMDGQVNALAWSGENNAGWWTFGQRKSDFQEFADGGEITGIIGGEAGLVLQRNAVRRMTYVGGNVIFRFDKISSNIGCASVHSVAQFGEFAFWHSQTGFKMWDGAQIRSIGFEKVDNDFAANYGEIDYSRMSTAVDGRQSLVCWSTGSKMWLYNWLLDRWSVVDFEAEIITQREGDIVNLEEQDSVYGSTDDNVDGASLPTLDSGRFVGGDASFYVFNNTHQIGSFNGENMAASITGRQLEILEGRDAYVRRVRPMSDLRSGVTLRLDTYQRLGDPGRRRDYTALRSSGEMPVRARGRFVKAELKIGANAPWSFLQGIDATVSAGGSR